MKKETREGYKMTELGEIPNGWEVVKLKEIICEFVVPMRDKPKIFDGNIPWCRIEDIEGNYLHGNREGRLVSEKIIEEMNLKVLPKNSLIASCSATLGVYAINTIPLITNQTFIGLIPGEKVSVKYLLYYMNMASLRLKKNASGTTIPYISRESFEQFNIALPTIGEQEKIAEILSTVDEQIENTEKLIQKNQELKKGLMQQLLTKGIGHTEFKKTELGEIPVEWEVIYLENIFEILDSYRKPIKASERELMRGNIPYYGASGIIDWVNDYIFDEELILLGEDGENLSSRNLDLAFKISGKSWINNHAHVFKIKDNKKHDIDFMVYYLESKDYSKYIAGSAQPKITQSQCRKFLLPSPTFEEQKKISLVLLEVDERIKEYQNKKEKLEKLKKGLMQSLLTGKIRLI
ncbi:restriction endonuclease subunit S [Clostridium perfringens]|uniref:restriction endonuclease subunit S n=1 Tax=Clostridium perfringens TaxID=1502 RepID=UPI000E11710C|nr:restriction endonuclease subunit S [Clostridium perfringens]MDH5064032.1 EcoKI restriction-modification system protein HsdS [Clostridium perfringens]SUY43059.1 type I restriction-modification enzyme, S subunit [Clostridium perfringens]